MSIFAANSPAFNTFINLGNVEPRIIYHLLYSGTRHANNIWRLLGYNEQNCLLRIPGRDNFDLTPKPYKNIKCNDLTEEQKQAQIEWSEHRKIIIQNRRKMIYTGTDMSAGNVPYRVFTTPMTDDEYLDKVSRINIYVERVTPTSNLMATVLICFEVIVHNKINNIFGEADSEDDKFLFTNPSELDEKGESFILNKSRATMFLKSILTEFNGRDVGGVGQLQHNMALSPLCVARQYLWNNRAFIGYAIPFATLMTGAGTPGSCSSGNPF